MCSNPEIYCLSCDSDNIECIRDDLCDDGLVLEFYCNSCHSSQTFFRPYGDPIDIEIYPSDEYLDS